MEENNQENLLPELIDIKNRVMAYNTVHPEGIFVYGFIGFKNDLSQKCECCGEDGVMVPDEKSSMFGGFGDIEDVRNLINMLRDMIEDNKEISENEDESDFVNF